ncbi:MAG: peptidoglycan editing factor PgeF [Ktedonobacterales bacterium]
MIECRTGACEYLRFQRLSQEPAVVHAVFTREGGVSAPPFATLNASMSIGDDLAAVRHNLGVIAATVNLPLASVRPVHGARVVEIESDGEKRQAGNSGPFVAWQERLRASEGDAMITDTPGYALFWAYADCVPILLYDPDHRAIALVHAGWRGTAQAVAARAVETMAQRFGSRPGQLLAGIAPSIGVCCYTVNVEVRERFRANPTAWATARFEERQDTGRADPTPRLYLDLWESNRGQLLAAGVAPDHIELAGICTGCHTDRFFSHRMEHGRTGRFGVAIGLVAA